MKENMRAGGLGAIIYFLATLGSQVFFGDHADFPLKLQGLPKMTS